MCWAYELAVINSNMDYRVISDKINSSLSDAQRESGCTFSQVDIKKAFVKLYEKVIDLQRYEGSCDIEPCLITDCILSCIELPKNIVYDVSIRELKFSLSP